MAIPKKVTNYLDKAKIKYEVLAHKTVFTAYDLAATLKEKMKNIAKTLLVKVDKRYVLIVLPAHFKLDLAAVKKFYKAKTAEIAKEGVMKKLFGFEPGTLTPFGALHKIDVAIDKGIARADNAVVRAGSYTESLRMKIKDIKELEDAAVGAFGKLIEVRKAQKKKKKK
ncbi:MAG: YbaK/EbsC family protein [Patescibacteria group bacterium]|nr:YbaK/EbsC family protein [Patescibacteria group bacterium]